jgi:Uma2 family endonuclease
MQLTLHALKITNEQFEQIVRANPEWNFEQTANGELIILPLSGGTLGCKNSNLTGQLGTWVEAHLWA